MGRVLVFLYDTMAGFEMSLASYLVNRYSGREVIGIGYEKSPVRDLSGILYTPTMTVAEAAKLPDVEALIIPGGQSGDLRPELAELIHRLDREERLLAAICAGPVFFALAGILKGRRYTTSLAEWDDTARQHYHDSDPFPRETYVGGRMVRDGHILTATGLAFVDFSVELADMFGIFAPPEDRNEYHQALRGPDPDER